MSSNWSHPADIDFPLTAEGLEEINNMFQKLFSKFPLGVNRGGTGLSDFEIGDLFYGDENAANEPFIALLSSVSAASYLRSEGVLTAPSWSTLKLPNSAAVGDIMIAATLDTISGLAIGAAGTIIRSNGTIPANTSFTIPNTFAQGDVLYGSATNVVSGLAKDATATRYLSNKGTDNAPSWGQVTLTNGVIGILPVANGGTSLSGYATGDLIVATSGTTLGRLAVGAANTFIRSNGSTPFWSTLTIPNTAVTGGILHASATSVGTFLAIAGAGTILRSTGTLPAYTTFTLPNTFAQGDLLHASAANVVTALAKDTNATRYLSNTGASNNPLWAQVALATGVSGTLPVANGGTNAGAFTLGSVVFAGTSGTYTQDNANFFWDNTNKFLSVGSATAQGVLSALKDWGGASATQLMAVFTSLDDAARFVIQRANGDVGAETQVLATQVIGNLNFRGFHSGGAYSTGTAAVSAVALENFTATAWGTSLAFGVTAVGSVSQAEAGRFHGSGGFTIGDTTDPGDNNLRVLGTITTGQGAFMIVSTAAFTNGAAGAAGTLLNAPTAGNPTKWIPVNDNGTTRYLPAW